MDKLHSALARHSFESSFWLGGYPSVREYTRSLAHVLANEDTRLELRKLLFRNSLLGIYRYTPPEFFITKKITEDGLTFACGIVGYEFFVGEHPFGETSKDQKIALLTSPSLPTSVGISSAERVLKSALHRDPLRRPRLQRLMERWVQSFARQITAAEQTGTNITRIPTNF